MRKQGWPTIIANGLKAHQEIEFEWGKKDCCMAVADIFKLYTGWDFAEKFRGKYTTASGSLRALKRYGAGTIEATIDTMMKRTSDPMRGDLAMVSTSAGESLAIIFSNQAWAMSESGLVSLPMSAVVTSWSVE